MKAALVVVAFVLALSACDGNVADVDALLRIAPAAAAPTQASTASAPCQRWRVTRDKVSVSGGAAAFVASEDGEPFAVQPIAGPGEQWAVFVRTCSR